MWITRICVRVRTSHVTSYMPRVDACRAGWTTKNADLEFPVGYAEDSFGVRDVDGAKISGAYRCKYMSRGFGVGDVLGCLIRLPSRDDSVVAAAEDTKTSSSSGEERSATPSPVPSTDDRPERPIASSSSSSSVTIPTQPTQPTGRIRFYINGKEYADGPAFDNVRAHAKKAYYPAVSLFMQGSVAWNFGPTFRYPPDTLTFANESTVETDDEGGCELENAVVRPFTYAGRGGGRSGRPPTKKIRLDPSAVTTRV